MVHTTELMVGGRTMQLETGRMARQANGAVLVRYGDTAVLVTATASHGPREGIDFFPLTVDVEERLYAVGKIPGGFIKREGRPSERSILTARLTDRPIRPLFPEGFRNDVHIVSSVLSVDYDHSPEITRPWTPKGRPRRRSASSRSPPATLARILLLEIGMP